MVVQGGDAAKQRINYSLFNMFGLCDWIKLSFIKYALPLAPSDVFFFSDSKGQAANSLSRIHSPDGSNVKCAVKTTHM